jgi:hypothetical protein
MGIQPWDAQVLSVTSADRLTHHGNERTRHTAHPGFVRRAQPAHLTRRIRPPPGPPLWRERGGRGGRQRARGWCLAHHVSRRAWRRVRTARCSHVVSGADVRCCSRAHVWLGCTDQRRGNRHGAESAPRTTTCTAGRGGMRRGGGFGTSIRRHSRRRDHRCRRGTRQSRRCRDSPLVRSASQSAAPIT